MSLKSRVQRLEAIMFPHKRPRVPTEQDIRFSQCWAELLLRVDPVFAQAIQEETRLRNEADESGYATLPMSNLYFGFCTTVREHVYSDSALEFPAIVAQAYLDAPDSKGCPVKCLACGYPLPWERFELKHCPSCSLVRCGPHPGTP